MPLSVREAGPGFAGEASGLDLTRPLSPADVAAIHAAMDKFAVLVFHDQSLTDESQLAFTQSLGTIEMAIGVSLRKPEEQRLPNTFADVSNLDKDGRPFARDDRRRLYALGNQLWHSDSSFKAVPAKYSLLHGRKVALKGGNTEFADMRAAYDALDQDTKVLCEELICEHSQMFSRAKHGFVEFSAEERERMKPVLQRLVREHPAIGRKSLYLSSHAGRIVGWPEPEAKAFLMDLTEHATQPEFKYVHKWRDGDLVMWDNRTTMHRARPFPHTEKRDMRRTTLMGDAPTVAQQAAE
ncbi:MAG: TauD/TfdA dioxygenase family protein [Hyphomicrobiaceae bacterium]